MTNYACGMVGTETTSAVQGQRCRIRIPPQPTETSPGRLENSEMRQPPPSPCLGVSGYPRIYYDEVHFDCGTRLAPRSRLCQYSYHKTPRHLKLVRIRKGTVGKVQAPGGANCTRSTRFHACDGSGWPDAALTRSDLNMCG